MSVERMIQAAIVKCDMFIASNWQFILVFLIFVIGIMAWSIIESKNERPKF